MLKFGSTIAIVGLILVLINCASAVEYKDKPTIVASIVDTNHLSRGDEKIVILSIYNGAVRKEVEYESIQEAGFFYKRESMLFTAYNVEVELEGNEYVKVKTPVQKIPALAPMRPVTLKYVLDVSEDAKAGEYELKLKVSFQRINKLKALVPACDTTEPFCTYPSEISYEIVGGNMTGNATKTYQYKQIIQEYKLDYESVNEEIPIKIYIEEKEVAIEVVGIKTENMMAKGKGKLVISVKNIGEKIARDAYLILKTPSGFKASALSISSYQQGQHGIPMSGMQIPGMMGIKIPTSAGTQESLSTAQATYYVGDLKPGETINATFYIKLNVKDEGTYPFEVKAVYKDEYGSLKETASSTFGVHVSHPPKFNIVDVVSKVFVNSKGEVVLKVISDTDLEDVSAIIESSPPISALSSEYYVGDVKAGKEFEVTFKLKASSEAKPIKYPASLKFKYKSLDEYIETDPVRFGVRVNPKVNFEVSGIPKIAAGEEKIITFMIKNLGEFEVRDATARITIVDPFSSTDDTAFLGNLKPGQTVNASFKISVDKDATPKLYALNLEVKYKDLEGEWAISEPTKAIIQVTPAKPPYILYSIVAIIAAIAVIVYFRSRK
ncbi:S-layer protein [Archaeoglobales archaeon]|nr:MAG: S-layer protein [Archaeoglobales archaeon]